MGYKVMTKSFKVLAKNALCTPFLIDAASRRPTPAVERDGVWYATTYDGFELQPGEVPQLVWVELNTKAED